MTPEERLRKRYGPAFQKKIDFYNKVAAPAVVAAEKLRMDPKLLMSQAALESGWGGSKLSTDAFNFGGVKAKGEQPYVEMESAEGYGKTRRMEKSKFAKYPSINAFFEEWPKTFAQPRYAKAIRETTPEGYARKMGAAGYFTEDPNKYAALLKGIYNDIDRLMMDQKIRESMISGQGEIR